MAQYVVAGTALGAGAGSTAGSVGGALSVGAVGSLIEPGGGTVIGGLLGADLGASGGALAGGSLGGALGGLFGNILCAKGSDPDRNNLSGNDEAARERQAASKITGKAFTWDLRDRFHRIISGQGYDYETLVEIAIDFLQAHG